MISPLKMASGSWFIFPHTHDSLHTTTLQVTQRTCDGGDTDSETHFRLDVLLHVPRPSNQFRLHQHCPSSDLTRVGTVTDKHLSSTRHLAWHIATTWVEIPRRTPRRDHVEDELQPFDTYIIGLLYPN